MPFVHMACQSCTQPLHQCCLWWARPGKSYVFAPQLKHVGLLAAVHFANKYLPLLMHKPALSHSGTCFQTPASNASPPCKCCGRGMDDHCSVLVSVCGIRFFCGLWFSYDPNQKYRAELFICIHRRHRRMTELFHPCVDCSLDNV